MQNQQISVGDLLNRLDRAKPNGADRWMARCPAHEDDGPSLSIRATGDRILLNCFAGCETEDVLAAIGLTFSDIMPERNPFNGKHQFIPRDMGLIVEELAHEVTVLLLILEEIGAAGAHTDRLVDMKRRINMAQRIFKPKSVKMQLLTGRIGGGR